MKGSGSESPGDGAFRPVGIAEARAATSGGLPAPTIPDHDLLRLIGHGAYGGVWLARNRTTNTWRAVKVVYRKEFEDERPYQREFEGLLKFEPVSRSHPGLVQVLHVGRNEAEGYFYYVMELADSAPVKMEDGRSRMEAGRSKIGDGETEPGASICDLRSPNSDLPHYSPHTLRSELKSRGRLPVDECLALGRSLAAALGHLHEHGLVHRDIKPSNLIFVNGQPKLADVGLVTEVGDSRSIVGTEGYLPPEGPGSPQADLFSLGKVLYEAATGLDRRQFPTLPSDLGTWPDRRRLLEVNEVVVKACARDATRRHGSAAALGAELERLQQGGSIRRRRTLEHLGRLGWKALPAAVVLVVALGVVWFGTRQASSPERAAVTSGRSIFVLPFRNAGTNQTGDDLRSRITDTFIDSLDLLKGQGLRVGPRKSAWITRDEDELRRQVGRDFRMTHVLTGRARVEEPAVDLRLALYATGKDQPLWTETYTGTTNDLIALEQQAIGKVAGALGLSITPELQRQMSRKLTNNLVALGYCRIGQSNSQRGSWTALDSALDAFNEALRWDAGFLDAEFGAAWVVREYAEERPHKIIWPEIRTRMQKVVQMDDTHFPARAGLLAHKCLYDWDWDGALADFERLRLEQPEEHLLWAMHYRFVGRFEEARIEQEMFERQNRTDVTARYHTMAARYVEGRYAEGIQEARKTLQMYPGHHVGFISLAYCAVEKPDYPLAIEATRQGRAVEDKQELEALLGYTYARMGEREKALEVLRQLKERARLHYVQPYFVARVHAALGQKDEALSSLEQACDDKSECLVETDWAGGGLRMDPAWRDLQTEPRFQALLKRVGLDVWPRWPR